MDNDIIEITELTDFFTVIKKEVDKAPFSPAKKVRVTNYLRKLITQGFELGKNGKTTIELSDFGETENL